MYWRTRDPLLRALQEHLKVANVLAPLIFLEQVASSHQQCQGSIMSLTASMSSGLMLND